MKSRVLFDFLLILFVYVICGFLIYAAITMNWPASLGVNEPNVADFTDKFQTWSEVAGGVSVFCALAWYILGEWGPRANRLSSKTWLAIWFALMLAVIAGTMASIAYLPEVDPVWIAAAFYVLWGPAFYYVATVLFSPANTKYIVPGSSLIRRGW